MASLRSRVVRPLHQAAFAAGLSTWLARSQPVRRIIMLHGIGPDEEVTTEAFDAGLGWLSARFRIVPLTEMLDSLAAGRPPQDELALTFDDGLRCHLEQAYPVLLRHQAPATFFVCPGLMEAGQWLWNHEARARLHRLDPASLPGHAQRWAAPSAEVENVIDWMKTLAPTLRQKIENEIRLATPGFMPSDRERARFDPLTWEDIGRLDPNLITIGSHTLMHPILTTLDDAELDFELRESRTVLEQRIGRSVDLFCYPNGSADDRVRAAAAKVYGSAVTTEYGHVAQGADRVRLPRIPVTDRLPLLAWRMHRPTA
jgi:peptidoglycan/xylan/chitin deacetylase (PgdA/CDA1 family)